MWACDAGNSTASGLQFVYYTWKQVSRKGFKVQKSVVYTNWKIITILRNDFVYCQTSSNVKTLFVLRCCFKLDKSSSFLFALVLQPQTHFWELIVVRDRGWVDFIGRQGAAVCKRWAHAWF